MFPGFDKFYVLTPSDHESRFTAELDLPQEKVLDLLRSSALRGSEIHARYFDGRVSPDPLIWTTSTFPVLISAPVVQALRESAASGWDVTPVLLQGRGRRETYRDYCFLHFVGRCGPIDRDKSVKEDKVYPGGTFPIWRGLYFDPATWDGSDFFMSSDANVAFTFLSDRAKRILEATGCDNVHCTPLTQFEREWE